MARKRTISPDLWTDEKVLALSWRALPFYVGLISLADDEGRLEWSPRQLYAKIVSVRPDVPFEDVVIFMAEVERELMSVYEVDGKLYAYHLAWHRHQYVNRPTESPIPDPPGLAKRYVRTAKGGVIDTRKTPIAADISQNRQLELATPSAPLTADSVSPTRLSVSVSESESVSDSVERDATKKSRSDSPGVDFAQWLVSNAVASGSLPAVLDLTAYAYKQAEVAARLVASYGRPECETRAHRLFAAHLSTGPDRIIRKPSCDVLEAWWNSPQLSGRALRAFGEPRPKRESRAPGYTPPARAQQWFEIGEDGVRRLMSAS